MNGNAHTSRTAGAAEQALAGRRVLDLAGEPGMYCGKLLADMGADVIKVEPPGGDPARNLPPFFRDQPGPDHSLTFLYQNTSKRGITLDLAREEGRDLFRRLARCADLVVETFPPDHLEHLGLGYDALSRDNPGIVLTSITGFGQTGPWRRYRSSDLVASALGGAMHVTGAEADPPVRLAGSQAYVAASTLAAVSSMIALHHSAATGAGQHVDVSCEEAVAAVTSICGAAKYLDDHIAPRRWGAGLFASVPSGTYACKDGLVYLMINRPQHWKTLARWIHEVTGNEVVLDPMFEGPSSVRQPNRDLLDVYIGELTCRFTVEEMYREGQARHLAFTPLNTAARVAADPHLEARGFFVEVDHPATGPLRYPGAPYRHAATPWQIRRPAPRLGEHNEEIYRGELGLSRDEYDALESDMNRSPRERGQPLPVPMKASERTSPVHGASPGSRRLSAAGANASQALSDLRVVEFTAGMAGPWIGRFMAFCGAEVIKVESPQHPDVTRLYVPPAAPDAGIQPQLSPWFTDWNAGKRFVALDLTTTRGVELAKAIVAHADVVVENYSTGVLDKLGLGYEALRAVKPDLVMFSSTGYGDSGPCRRYVTWGPNIEALSGLATLSGFADRECTITQFAYPDPLSALHGLFAVLCALDHRRRTGRGQYVNLSQYETTVAAIGTAMLEYLADGREPVRRGNAAPDAAPHGCYRCAGEDRWCVIAVSSDEEWARLCQAIGRPQLAADSRFSTLAARLAHVEELDRVVEAWTSTRDAYDAMTVLQAAGVAAGVVQNIADQLERDPQLAARGFFEEIAHARLGKVIANGIPLGLTGTPGRSGLAGAAVGQDNEYVFGQLLGMSAQDIEACVAAGAIQTGGPAPQPAPR